MIDLTVDVSWVFRLMWHTRHPILLARVAIFRPVAISVGQNHNLFTLNRLEGLAGWKAARFGTDSKCAGKSSRGPSKKYELFRIDFLARGTSL